MSEPVPPGGEAMTTERVQTAEIVRPAPRKRHAMTLPIDTPQCPARLGEDRCLMIEGHLERHATPAGERFDDE